MYIIYWVITTFTLVPCPDKFIEDEFGRKPSGFTDCAVAHYEVLRESRHKAFSDRDSALAFYNRAKSEPSFYDMWGLDQGIEDVCIDSFPQDTLKHIK